MYVSQLVFVLVARAELARDHQLRFNSLSLWSTKSLSFDVTCDALPTTPPLTSTSPCLSLSFVLIVYILSWLSSLLVICATCFDVFFFRVFSFSFVF